MGLLDDAIRQHLDLKRQHGASSEELAEKEAEAFGPARRERAAPQPADHLPVVEEVAEEAPLAEELLLEEPLSEEPVLDEPLLEEPTQMLESQAAEPGEPEPVAEAPPRRGDTPPHGTPAVEPDPADEIFADEAAEPTPEEEEEEDVLEETPDFLQETPEHDRLWFEQKPPRDFDFDDD